MPELDTNDICAPTTKLGKLRKLVLELGDFFYHPYRKTLLSVALGDAPTQTDADTAGFIDYVAELMAQSPDFAEGWTQVWLGCGVWRMSPPSRGVDDILGRRRRQRFFKSEARMTLTIAANLVVESFNCLNPTG
ncbi:hypothetical protein F4818DRAFT_441642 [Hypoxylon cercidicola]|nr:hypothetical protein F4818DRAFT_441642 [Hypoxylon cercidicola]